MTNREQWVLQFCHSYSAPFTDCIRQYALLCRESGYRVATVYLSGQPDVEVEQRSESDEVIFLGYESTDLKGLKASAIRDLRHLAKQREYAFCIAHRFKPIYIALFATSLPVIGIHHTFGVYKRWSRRFVVNRFRNRLLLLGVSRAVRDEIKMDLGRRWPESRARSLYNCIDLASVQAEQVERQEARAHLAIPENAWVVGNVGRLHPGKDQETLIRGFATALPMLPANSLLAIMGSGRLEEHLKVLVAELGLNDSVVFVGQVKNGRRYFKAFDVFALTSDHEPFGMVLLEAMAAGVPLISSDCGGAREVVSGLGLLFPLGSPETLAKCLQDVAVLSEQELSAKRQAMLQSLRDNYTDEAVRPVFLELLNESGLFNLAH